MKFAGLNSLPSFYCAVFFLTSAFTCCLPHSLMKKYILSLYGHCSASIKLPAMNSRGMSQ
eukprot:c31742_g1_i1 orf=95-274(+)